MNRKAALKGHESLRLFEQLKQVHEQLGQGFQEQFQRSIPFADELFDRWERAENLDFGSGTGIYDSSFVFGDVVVGTDTWIGPFTIIDGSGGLTIGNHCTVSAGVHIYTHDNVAQTITGGKSKPQRAPVTIGNNCYIGPQVIIAKGVTIGNCAIVAAGSFVNKDVPAYSVAGGTPAKVIGTVTVEGEEMRIDYHTAPKA